MKKECGVKGAGGREVRGGGITRKGRGIEGRDEGAMGKRRRGM